MHQQTHAHDVIELIDQHNGQFTRDALRHKLAETFGSGSGYYACTEENMNGERIIDFLLEREKIVETDGRFSVNRGNLCNH